MKFKKDVTAKKYYDEKAEWKVRCNRWIYSTLKEWEIKKYGIC